MEMEEKSIVPPMSEDTMNRKKKWKKKNSDTQKTAVIILDFKQCGFNIQFHVQEMSRLMTKPTKWHVHPAKTRISLGICPVWSDSLSSAWRKLGSLATHWAHSEDSDQTGCMPRLIRVFAGRTVILLVLSWGDSDADRLANSVDTVHGPRPVCTNI